MAVMIISLENYCNEPSARAVGRYTQDAKVPVPAQRFGGIVEGVMLAVGEIGHDGTLAARQFVQQVEDLIQYRGVQLAQVLQAILLVQGA